MEGKEEESVFRFGAISLSPLPSEFPYDFDISMMKNTNEPARFNSIEPFLNFKDAPVLGQRMHLEMIHDEKKISSSAIKSHYASYYRRLSYILSQHQSTANQKTNVMIFAVGFEPTGKTFKPSSSSKKENDSVADKKSPVVAKKMLPGKIKDGFFADYEFMKIEILNEDEENNEKPVIYYGTNTPKYFAVEFLVIDEDYNQEDECDLMEFVSRGFLVKHLSSVKITGYRFSNGENIPLQKVADIVPGPESKNYAPSAIINMSCSRTEKSTEKRVLGLFNDIPRPIPLTREILDKIDYVKVIQTERLFTVVSYLAKHLSRMNDAEYFPSFAKDENNQRSLQDLWENKLKISENELMHFINNLLVREGLSDVYYYNKTMENGKTLREHLYEISLGNSRMRAIFHRTLSSSKNFIEASVIKAENGSFYFESPEKMFGFSPIYAGDILPVDVKTSGVSSGEDNNTNQTSSSVEFSENDEKTIEEAWIVRDPYFFFSDTSSSFNLKSPMQIDMSKKCSLCYDDEGERVESVLSFVDNDSKKNDMSKKNGGLHGAINTLYAWPRMPLDREKLRILENIPSAITPDVYELAHYDYCARSIFKIMEMYARVSNAKLSTLWHVPFSSSNGEFSKVNGIFSKSQHGNVTNEQLAQDVNYHSDMSSLMVDKKVMTHDKDELRKITLLLGFKIDEEKVANDSQEWYKNSKITLENANEILKEEGTLELIWKFIARDVNPKTISYMVAPLVITGGKRTNPKNKKEESSEQKSKKRRTNDQISAPLNEQQWDHSQYIPLNEQQLDHWQYIHNDESKLVEMLNYFGHKKITLQERIRNQSHGNHWSIQFLKYAFTNFPREIQLHVISKEESIMFLCKFFIIVYDWIKLINERNTYKSKKNPPILVGSNEDSPLPQKSTSLFISTKKSFLDANFEKIFKENRQTPKLILPDVKIENRKTSSKKKVLSTEEEIESVMKKEEKILNDIKLREEKRKKAEERIQKRKEADQKSLEQARRKLEELKQLVDMEKKTDDPIIVINATMLGVEEEDLSIIDHSSAPMDVGDELEGDVDDELKGDVDDNISDELEEGVVKNTILDDLSITKKTMVGILLRIIKMRGKENKKHYFCVDTPTKIKEISSRKLILCRTPPKKNDFHGIVEEFNCLIRSENNDEKNIIEWFLVKRDLMKDESKFTEFVFILVSSIKSKDYFTNDALSISRVSKTSKRESIVYRDGIQWPNEESMDLRRELAFIFSWDTYGMFSEENYQENHPEGLFGLAHSFIKKNREKNNFKTICYDGELLFDLVEGKYQGKTSFAIGDFRCIVCISKNGGDGVVTMFYPGISVYGGKMGISCSCDAFGIVSYKEVSVHEIYNFLMDNANGWMFGLCVNHVQRKICPFVGPCFSVIKTISDKSCELLMKRAKLDTGTHSLQSMGWNYTENQPNGQHWDFFPPEFRNYCYEIRDFLDKNSHSSTNVDILSLQACIDLVSNYQDIVMILKRLFSCLLPGKVEYLNNADRNKNRFQDSKIVLVVSGNLHISAYALGIVKSSLANEKVSGYFKFSEK